MIFKKYREMENSYRTGFMNKIIEEGFTSPKIKWVALEKVHGANSGLWTDGIEVRMSKKSSFIKNTENFFKADKVLAMYTKDALDIYRTLAEKYQDIKSLCIWGELFGGSYPHPDVQRDNDAKQVQKGIWYSPINDFIVFDIMVTLDTNEDIYLNWNDVMKLTSVTNLTHVPLLAEGTFDEMIKFENDGQSVVHHMYGLPTIEDNIMEGVVLKPIEPLFLRNGSRVIVKNKNPKWEEKGKAPKRQRVQTEINEVIQPIVDELSLYVTENRLRNVLSHIGEVTQRDFGLVNKEMIADIMKDYLIDNGKEKINALEKIDRKLINKKIGKQTADLIRKNFVNIIDNEF